MSPTILLLIALGLGLAGWLAARARAFGFKSQVPAGRLAALPNYHAWYVALWVFVPAVIFIAIWSQIAPQMVTSAVLADPAAANLPEFGFHRRTILNEAAAVAMGNAQGVFNEQAKALVEPYREAIMRTRMIGIAVTVILGFVR